MKRNKQNALIIFFLTSLIFSCTNPQQKDKLKKNRLNKNLIGTWQVNSMGTSFINRVNEKKNITSTKLYIPFLKNELLTIKENSNIYVGENFIGKIICIEDSLLISCNLNKDQIGLTLPTNKLLYFKAIKDKGIIFRFKLGNGLNEVEFYYSLNRYRNGRLLEKTEVIKLKDESIKE